MVPRAACAALGAALFLGACVASHLAELRTTWRAGDFIAYRAGCHKVEDMLAVAVRGSNELFQVYRSEGRCFALHKPLAAILIRLIDGPFRHPDGRDGSVWQIKDAAGDKEFIWAPDEGGSHEVAIEA